MPPASLTGRPAHPAPGRARVRRQSLSVMRLKAEDTLTDEEILRRIRATVDNEQQFEVFKCLLKFNQHVLKTNFYQPTKVALSFRLDPSFLPPSEYPNKLFGMFFVIGSEFRGFHLRFADIARGGIRIVRSANKEMFGINCRNLFDENYNLASTQERKNKDIPESGSKGTILLDEKMQDRPKVAFEKYVDAILDLIIPGQTPGIKEVRQRERAAGCGRAPDWQRVATDANGHERLGGGRRTLPENRRPVRQAGDPVLRSRRGHGRHDELGVGARPQAVRRSAAAWIGVVGDARALTPGGMSPAGCGETRAQRHADLEGLHHRQVARVRYDRHTARANRARVLGPYLARAHARAACARVPAAGGIPHDKFGMTTRSVHQYVLGICRKLNINEEDLDKLQTGGPDGDLGSNEIKISKDRTIGTRPLPRPARGCWRRVLTPRAAPGASVPAPPSHCGRLWRHLRPERPEPRGAAAPGQLAHDDQQL